MRIERLRVESFGRLARMDTGPRPLPGLVVVLGPNEAGKSTLFHFLGSMLYGFHPASREGNPYTPWDGSEMGGSLHLRLDGGGCVEVERRLLSAPGGRLVVDGRAEDLRNRTVPWVEHVPRAVFRQVYALTLADLAGLDGETWARVQDRILGAMGATDLRPARHVVGELEQEAGELWRPNRRGNQRIRGLQDALRELRERRRAAGERDRRVREIVAEAERARERLAEVRRERQRARLALDRIQSLVPVRAQLRRIATLLEEAGPAEGLDGFPADPAVELRALRDRLAGLQHHVEGLDGERAEPDAAAAAFGPAERRVLARAGEVARFLARAAGLTPDRTRLAALEQECRDLERRIHTAARPLLAFAEGALPSDAIAAVPAAELRERVRALHSARDQRRALEAALEREPGAPADPGPFHGLGAGVLLLAGVGLLGAGLWRGSPALASLGAAAAALGAAGLLARVRRAASLPAGGAALRERLEGARRAEASARSAVHELTGALTLHASVREEPDERLVAGLERLQELLRDRSERTRAAADVSGRIAAADEEARALSSSLGVDGWMDASALAPLLERELRRSERSAEAAAAAERDLARLDRERARATEEVTVVQAVLADLERRLAAEGDDDPALGARRVQERLRSAERARQLQHELERAHPDLEAIRARIAEAEASGEDWTSDDEDLARRKALVEQLTDEAEGLVARAEALERDAAHLREQETVDAVDGEIAAREEEEQALLIERDRRWILAQLLRQADRRFREEHQPDLMRRAGVHLKTLTGGRYDRIMADEGAGDGRFQILGPGAPGPLTLGPPVSTGTLEQAYLALRLAIVDHLDEALERLPLFVDEVFVNWDERRRACGMELLSGIAEQRQVFAFTCHPEVARALEARGGLVLPVGG